MRERFQFVPFWKLTMLGFAGWWAWMNGWWRYGPIALGCDEWHNPSLMVDVPFVGQFVFFYSRDFDRSTWWTCGSVNNVTHYYSPDHKWIAYVPGVNLDDIERTGDWTLTDAEISVRASHAERIDNDSL